MSSPPACGLKEVAVCTLRSGAASRPRRGVSPVGSAAGSVIAPVRLEQEPDAPFRFVYPILQQAGAGDIAMLVAEAVRLAHALHHLQVVLAQLGDHVA